MTQIGTQLGRVVERERAARELAHQATHDALTGLPNRVLIVDQLSRSLARQLRRDGERASRCSSSTSTASRPSTTRSATRPATSCCARSPAGSGAVVRPQDTSGAWAATSSWSSARTLTAERPVVTIAERLGGVLRRARSSSTDEQFLVTASIGIVARRGGAEDAGTLLEQADAAMYRAKASGRARYEVFSEACASAIAAPSSSIERALRHATDAAASCGSTTSPAWTCAPGAVRASRRSCAGSTRARAADARRLHPAGRGDRPDRPDRAPGCSSEALPAARQRGRRRRGSPTCPGWR